MTWLYDYTHVEVQNAAGAWVDITAYVRPNRAAVQSSRGRDTELDVTGVPGRLTMGLDDSSGIFTPGRSAATLQITLGMPVRVTDVIGYKSFRWFTGAFELPDSVEQLAGVDNLITVTAVDRKQLLDNARTFVSTLGEYIIYNGGPSLVGYWSLISPSGQFESEAGNQKALRVEDQYIGPTTGVTGVGNPALLAFAGQPGPPGDDGTYPQFNPIGDASTSQARKRIADRFLSGVTFAGTGYVTFALWAYIGAFTSSSNQTLVARDNGFLTDIQISYTSLAKWEVSIDTSAGSLVLTSDASMVVGQWALLAVRINCSTGDVDFWINSNAYAGTLGGPSTGSFDSVVLDGYTTGCSAAHLQIYVHATSAGYDFTKHLAQQSMGFTGLVYQRTDERIRTVLNYAAGSNTAIPAVLDEGSTYMQRARLAGKKPGQCIDEASDTEVGRFFVDGSGTAHFHSRVRAHYNL